MRTPGTLVAALRAADATLPAGEWIRATGYPRVGGRPDDGRWLDGAVAGRPVRVQHRSGAAWILNGAAAAVVGLDAVGAADIGAAGPAGVERDRYGRPTGRLFGADDWLRGHVPAVALDVDAVGAELAGYGVTAVTDATPIEQADRRPPRRRRLVPVRVVVGRARSAGRRRFPERAP